MTCFGGHGIEGARRPDRGAELRKTDNSTRDRLWLVSFRTVFHAKAQRGGTKAQRKPKFVALRLIVRLLCAPLRETFFLPYIDRSLFEG